MLTTLTEARTESSGATARTSPRPRPASPASAHIVQKKEKAQTATTQQLQKKSMQQKHIDVWKKDWNTFKTHHRGEFNARQFHRWVIWSPWLLFPFSAYASWWNAYGPCWHWYKGGDGLWYRYPCYWDHGHARSLNLVYFAQNQQWDKALTRLEERIKGLESRVEYATDSEQRDKIQQNIEELKWYRQDAEKLKTEKGQPQEPAQQAPEVAFDEEL